MVPGKGDNPMLMSGYYNAAESYKKHIAYISYVHIEAFMSLAFA